MIRNLVGAAAIVGCVFAGSAQAANDSMVMPQPWAGFYVGGTLGGGWGTAIQTSTFSALYNTVDMSGVVGGVVGGYNWQFDRFVFGVEADASLSSIAGTSPAAAGKTCFSGSPDCQESIKSLITGRVRLGLPVGRFLPYVTGGIAFGDVVEDTGNSFTDIQGWQTGYVLGGGVDVALHDGWAVRAEYLFVNLGSNSRDVGGGFTNTNTEDGTHIVRVAITKQIP